MTNCLPWTDERVAKLKKLWEEGLSCSRIAASLGGTTRNAVISKINRMGLSGRITVNTTTAVKRRPARPRIPRTTQSPIAKPKPENEPPSNKNCTVTTRKFDTECAWPHGDPASPDFHFCGQPKMPGASYCSYHAGLAYEAPRSRRKQAPKQTSIHYTPEKSNLKEFEDA